MKSKPIIYGTKAREKILSGMEKLYRTVSATLGPRSGAIAIDKGYETIVIKDGYNVAKEAIDKIKDPYERVGARILYQAIEKQVDEVGDGTTLVTILAYNIAKEANKIVAAGVNGMSLREGLEKLRDEVVDKIEKQSIPVSSLDQKTQIATISSSDKELGKLIGETLHKIGLEGVFTIEESHSRDTTVEMQEGLQIDKGWRLPHFITDPENETAVLEGARVLVTDRVISDFQAEFQPFLAKFVEKSKTLFVIAQDYEGNVLPSFIVNKMNGKLNVLCVQAPLFENIQKALLQDIAVLTGATVIGEDTGIQIKDVEWKHLGFASKIMSTKDATIITGGGGDKKEIKTRIKSIKKQMENEESSFEVAKLQERLAKLTGAVAVIKVGGATEVEMKDRKEKVDDAVRATRTAMRSGIVAGGEITLLEIAPQLKSKMQREKDDLWNTISGQNTINIVANAIETPFFKLMDNADMNSGEHKEKLKHLPQGIGFNVITEKETEMVKEGIVDPAEVLTAAIYNAISVATQAATTEAIIPFEEVKK